MRALLIVGLLGACELGNGTGNVSGSLYVRSCTNDSDFGNSPTAQRAYNMNPGFFAAAPVEDFEKQHPMNRVSLRIQPSGNRVEEADVLGIQVANAYDVATTVGQNIEVGAATNVRATLNLNVTCPKAEVEMVMQGTINWTNFGSAAPGGTIPQDFKINYEDRLTASFSFDVIDLRAATLGQIAAGGVSPDAAVSGHLDGNFDFVVRQGRAAQSP
jgi:hypothetical protein